MNQLLLESRVPCKNSHIQHYKIQIHLSLKVFGDPQEVNPLQR
ncbi:Uncharacterised protein [Salmonella enterica subsp. enterica serovar Typhimurium str. DT104]|nr:Uncharacterised protein [Salmonella enterica subsp. enterica serovar Typhimurium str. DT104]